MNALAGVHTKPAAHQFVAFYPNDSVLFVNLFKKLETSFTIYAVKLHT